MEPLQTKSYWKQFALQLMVRQTIVVVGEPPALTATLSTVTGNSFKQLY